MTEGVVRGRLLMVLATMPDEAFGWFVGWASGMTMQYPDGLGGFQDASRVSIEALRREATALMDAMDGPQDVPVPPQLKPKRRVKPQRPIRLPVVKGRS